MFSKEALTNGTDRFEVNVYFYCFLESNKKKDEESYQLLLGMF